MAAAAVTHAHLARQAVSAIAAPPPAMPEPANAPAETDD
jgi:hypothetical protein